MLWVYVAQKVRAGPLAVGLKIWLMQLLCGQVGVAWVVGLKVVGVGGEVGVERAVKRWVVEEWVVEERAVDERARRELLAGGMSG
jgi:hypothetical protein